jgi:hypothetical protein
MKRNETMPDLVIEAGLKLDATSGERQNVWAFVQSCYCGRVRSYDLDAAIMALSRLPDEEEQALITWIVRQDERAARSRAPGCAR